MKPATILYRQGDVLLRRVEPKSALKPRPASKAGVVLAYGEVTGHAHVLDPQKVTALVKERDNTVPWDAAAERYIQVLEATSLKHLDLPAGGKPTGEHADIALEPGLYQVIRQREWDDAQERYVAD